LRLHERFERFQRLDVGIDRGQRRGAAAGMARRGQAGRQRRGAVAVVSAGVAGGRAAHRGRHVVHLPVAVPVHVHVAVAVGAAGVVAARGRGAAPAAAPAVAPLPLPAVAPVAVAPAPAPTATAVVLSVGRRRRRPPRAPPRAAARPVVVAPVATGPIHPHRITGWHVPAARRVCVGGRRRRQRLGRGGGFGGDIFVAIPVTFPFRPVLLVTAARRDHPAERIDRDVLGVVRTKHLKMICGGCKADCCCTVLYGGLLLHEKRGNDNKRGFAGKKCWSKALKTQGTPRRTKAKLWHRVAFACGRLSLVDFPLLRYKVTVLPLYALSLSPNDKRQGRRDFAPLLKSPHKEGPVRAVGTVARVH